MIKSTQILKEIGQLISSVENSSIEKTNKLKIIKVLFAIKLKLIGLLERELKMEAKMAKNESHAIQISNKQDLILQFIKNKSGRVSTGELLNIGIAGRSLRRYIKNLINEKRIKIEKSGRNYFYSLA